MGLWLHCSSVLNPWNFHLWDTLKDKEHNYSPHTEDDPEGSIHNRAFSILPTEFRHAANSMFMLILEHSSQTTHQLVGRCFCFLSRNQASTLHAANSHYVSNWNFSVPQYSRCRFTVFRNTLCFLIDLPVRCLCKRFLYTGNKYTHLSSSVNLIQFFCPSYINSSRSTTYLKFFFFMFCWPCISV